jgi:predicted CXXCH cytochrome family protein
MKFLMHQRDATVLKGERDKKYSLVGCIDCHNPAGAGEKVVRYEDPEHFCSSCHQYTSVKIDCFECHADRGLESSQQSWLKPDIELTAHSFDLKKEQVHGD